ADSCADSIHFNVEPRFVSDIGEGAVVIVVIKLWRSVFLRMTRPVHSIHQKNIRPAVVVVVDEGDAGTHGLRQKLFSESSIVVNEMNSRFCGYVLKRNAGFGALRVCIRRKTKGE